MWPETSDDVHSPSGVKLLFPFKIYCYNSLKSSLERFISRDEFEIDCEAWRERQTITDTLSDVYDGEVWKTFSKDGTLFFEKKRNYGLMLNLDWFQPFKHLSYLILLGIIPNMNK